MSLPAVRLITLAVEVTFPPDTAKPDYCCSKRLLTATAWKINDMMPGADKQLTSDSLLAR